MSVAVFAISLILYITRYNIITQLCRHCYVSVILFFMDISTCTSADIEYWHSEYGIKFDKPNCCCFECRGKKIDYALTDERLRDYMLHMANGGGSTIERSIWEKCVVHENITMTVSHNSDVRIENQTTLCQMIVSVYNHRYVRAMIILLISFIIAVMTSHLWVTKISLFDTATLSLYDCHQLSLDSHSGMDAIPLYCSTLSKYVWHAIDYHASYHHIPRKRGNTSGGVLFVDTEHEVYDIYHTMKGNRLVARTKFIQELEVLRKDHRINCICPVFMGIVGNVLFIYDKFSSEWRIMHQPFVYRNDTLSREIESTIFYEKDILHHNYNAFVSTVLQNRMTRIHHETIYVEYSEIVSPPPSVDDLLKEYNRELTNIDVIDKCVDMNDHHDRTRAFGVVHIDNEMVKQKHAMFTGDDAICYSFCDYTNKEIL